MFLAFIDQILPTLIIFGGIILAIVIVYFVFYVPRHKSGKIEIGVKKLEQDPDEVIEDSVQIKPIIKAQDKEVDYKEVEVDEQVAEELEAATEEKLVENVEESSEDKPEVVIPPHIDPKEVEVDDIDIPQELSVEEEKMLIPEDSLEVLEQDMEDKKEQKRLEKQKVEESNEETKELGKYHVLYRKDDNKWYVKREGSDKTLRVLETQAEAIAWATIKALNQDTTIVIHKRDGKIRKQNY